MTGAISTCQHACRRVTGPVPWRPCNQFGSLDLGDDATSRSRRPRRAYREFRPCLRQVHGHARSRCRSCWAGRLRIARVHHSPHLGRWPLYRLLHRRVKPRHQLPALPVLRLHQAQSPVLLAPAPTVSISNATVTERDTAYTLATFTLTRTGGTGAFGVCFLIASGTAQAGLDLAGGGGFLNFAACQISQTITIAVTGDTIAEGNETFMLISTALPTAPSSATARASARSSTMISPAPRRLPRRFPSAMLQSSKATPGRRRRTSP